MSGLLTIIYYIRNGIGYLKERKKQTNMKSKKILFIIIIIIIDISANLILLNIQLNNMEGSSELINDIGRIRGGIQRAVKLEIAFEENENAISYVDDIINKIETEESSETVVSDKLMTEINRISCEWESLKKDFITYQPGQTGSLEDIIEESECLWTLADEAVTTAQNDQEENINSGEYMMYFLLFNLLLGIILFRIIRKYVKNELEVYANYDFLTKLYNRKFLMNYLDIEMKKMERKKTQLSILLLDIDNFKRINDTFGHVEGDRILKEVAAIIKNTTRKGDIVSRYGGEEFIVLLSDTNEKDAYIVAEKVREAIEKNDFNMDKVTVSIGISNMVLDESVDNFISRADEALYEAKKTGKNKSVMYSNV